MCLSKFSNIDLLKQVANNLYSTEDNEDINGLCEKELAALINIYYQVSSILYNILINTYFQIISILYNILILVCYECCKISLSAMILETTCFIHLLKGVIIPGLKRITA